MWILADESGDFGFSYNEKSPSKYFVITLLVCEDVLVVKKTKSAVRKTLQNVNHKKSKSRLVDELKGSNTSLSIKKYFFRLMEHIQGLLTASKNISKSMYNCLWISYLK